MADPRSERACEPVTETTYTVTGTVGSPDRAIMKGLQVQIVDQGVGEHVHLTETVTNDCGTFKASFPADMITSRGKRRPDLQARVYSAGALIAESEIHYNASANETIDVTLPAGTREMPAEHDTVVSAIRSHFSGPLDSLKEDDDRKDITYLANKSGWDARAVAMASLAEQFSRRSGASGEGSVPAPFFYALFRAGLPANEDTLYHTDQNTLRAIWQTAAEQGMISQDLLGQVPTVLNTMERLSVDKLLNGPAVVGPSSMQSMLEVAELDPMQQRQFAQIYARHRTDPENLWDDVEGTLGTDAARRLQIDGKLAYMTINNAPLMQRVRDESGGPDMGDLVQLVEADFHNAWRWEDVLDASIPIPNEIPGDSDDERRSNYAEYLAAQVTLSYPTAAVAQRVVNGEIPVENPGDVHGFLRAHQGSFEIGVQPVEQYVAENSISVQPEVLMDLKSLQRVYQITPTDNAMGGMIANGLDAAAHVARYDREAFVDTFGTSLGGAAVAEQIHERALEVHNAVLNIAISYITASNGLALGSAQLGTASANTSTQVIQPGPMGNGSVSQVASNVIAYPTLESLFGEMDFCSCDHCRSILSPAAYLVDLLDFIDHNPPPGSPATVANPQTVLFQRRPDIEHLPLTCENTNTALPYIDVVNETLEYYITHSLSLTNYRGYDTGSMKSEDLLANPAFVNDTAYSTLQSQRFPILLPFHRSLESLRRHFEKFDVTLPLAMERLRPNDNLERLTNVYGWRDILMEELRLSRGEHEVLTDSVNVPLWKAYGFPSGTVDATVIAGLSNAKSFTRRLEISYDELVDLLKARFINPNADLIPKVEKLRLPMTTLKAASTMTDAAFDALLPKGAGMLDPAEYGGNIRTWVVNNYNRIKELITLADVTLQGDECSFDLLELRKAEPMTSTSDTSTRLSAVAFTRIIRFIRLWKKLGWTIEQTDAAICALYRNDFAQITETDVDTLAELDAGFLTLLPRLGVIVRTMRTLNLTVKRDLFPLLAVWGNIGTYGPDALYRTMFLNPTILKQDPVYSDNGTGVFLAPGAATIVQHVESLRAAFNLTSEEFDRIFTSLNFNSSTLLTIPNISAIYRRGYVARALRISVRELLLLISMTGLDPFAAPTVTAPAILRLAALVADLRELSVKPATALYLVWNQDLTGRSAPGTAEVNEFVRALRSDFTKIEQEFAIADDPGGEIAQARMTLMYGTEATDFFFGLLNDTFVSEAAYNHFAPSFGTALATAVATAGGTYGSPATARVAYDDFRKRLTYNGVMDIATRNAIKAVVFDANVIAEVPGGSLASFQTTFQAAVDALYTANNTAVSPFFARYAELLPLYQAYVTSVAPLPTRRSTLLASFIPSLVSRRKTQQTLQRLAEAAQTDRAFAEALVKPSPASAGLHKAGNTALPALNDLLALETAGLSVQFYDGNTIGSNPHAPAIAANLAYATGSGNTLPGNITSPGNAISGVWSGNIEAPEGGLYNFVIEAEALSTVGLKIDGNIVALTQTGTTWRNTNPITLKAGTLYGFELTVERVQSTLRVKWETAGLGLAVIPAKALYPSSLVSTARNAYLRFLKGAAIAEAFGLTAAETARPILSGVSWLNAIPVVGSAGSPTTLLAPFRELVDYAVVKDALEVEDDSLLRVMLDPATTTAQNDSLLFTFTGWDRTSLLRLVTQFVGAVANLSQPALFRRVYEAFELVRAFGISADALINATTNDPSATVTRNFQSAIRARYSLEDWRTVVQPINDQMRSLQRDALVAYILHQMRSNVSTQHINTTEKLFEFFLMDVQMEPCMQTSRIRHALSSVQLFIERCMMNLEPRVLPASMSAKQWEWMKRYRVWEANRKVFLFPENWLEPELRDDKSPFFKEIEGELLASDVTEESATVAMLNYLAKLEEVAKLEPCSLHHIAANPAIRRGEVNHVIARTPGSSRKYYYRRREYGYWTPWEHVKLDIDDNPVVPVVWRDRLLLFWLRLVKTGPTNTGGVKPGGTDLPNMVLPPTPQMTVKAILYWSEYYNGKWQPAKSSDVERPVVINSMSPDGFDRADMEFNISEDGDALRVTIGYGTSFLFYNTHSEPLYDAGYAISTWFQRLRLQCGTSNELNFGYLNTGWTNILTRSVLKPLQPYRMIIPRHPVDDIWNSPFFYLDKRHVFYVSSRQEQVAIPFVTAYGVPVGTARQARQLPPVVTTTNATAGVTARNWANGVVLGNEPLINPNPVYQFVTEDANIRQGLGTTAPVTFGGVEIGPGGAITNQG